MLDIESCIALSGLTEEEIEALATHACIPAMLAVGLGSHLARLPDGPERICEIIAQDIRAAQRRGDFASAASSSSFSGAISNTMQPSLRS